MISALASRSRSQDRYHLSRRFGSVQLGFPMVTTVIQPLTWQQVPTRTEDPMPGGMVRQSSVVNMPQSYRLPSVRALTLVCSQRNNAIGFLLTRQRSSTVGIQIGRSVRFNFSYEEGCFEDIAREVRMPEHNDSAHIRIRSAR